MKIRQGFVSNSSSTSFTFIHKGDDLTELYKQIKQWDQYFQLRFDAYGEKETWCINEDNVINALQENEKYFTEKHSISIDTYIEHLKKEKEDAEQYLREREAEDEDSWWIEHLHQKSFELFQKVYDAEEMKKRGFKTVHIIGFGDNHGEICGGIVGNVMDYAGRHIYIDKDGFIVFTEQNR